MSLSRFIALSGLVLVLATGCAGPATMRIVPASPVSPTAGAQPVFRQPQELRSSNGLLRVRLVVERRTVRLAGQDVRAMTYNGHYMPPTLRLRPGDRLDLTLVNRLGEHTNLHTHGWHVSPSGNSDNIYLHIMPGQSYHYSYRLREDLAPGTYWYHSHAHPLSEPQVLAGLSGAIVIDGLKRYLPPGLRGITERLIALKDVQIKNGVIPTANIDSNAPTNRTVNGLVNPIIGIRPGETQLWRLANIGADIAYNVQLQGARFTVLAQDANPVDRTWSDDALLLPPGSRYDVLVQGPPPGRTQLITTAYSTGPDGDDYPQTTLATLHSAGNPVRPAALPADFAEIDDLSHDPLAQRRTITFSENDQTSQFYINGKQWAADRIDVRAKLNTTEEWVVRNVADEQHTFHVHVNDFQLMSVNGRPYPFRGWQDTVQLPARGQVVIRMRFHNFTGKYPYHCHILNHEDNGMMANLEVVR
ncbi:multicopper oxidase family protein [Nonomuraea sp. KM90]|uniref:multicopper oxidase family protein n=1 Tax=Nonomuraea sp. KM90 TaxID=3457428 RepID=UPI003FCDB7B0